MKSVEEFYIAYKDDVYRYLVSLTHDPILSEDLLSETFLRAVTSFVNFRRQSSIKTWLFGIARNMWLQQLREKHPSLQYEDFLQYYVTEHIEENVLHKEALHRVNVLLQMKDDKTRKVVMMRLQGYSYMEIAQTVKISESSARVIDFRTKKWIKTVLIEEGLV